MKASVIRPGELGEPELGQWSALQAWTLELQSPFISAAFARAVGSISDRARVAVIEDGPTIVGFLAYELRSKGVAAPIGRKLNNRQAFVHAPGLRWSWPELLAATNLDVLELGDLVGSQSDHRRSLPSVASPVIDTSEGWDAYLQSLRTRKHVKTTLYKERKLRREFEDVVFESGPAKDWAQLR